MFFVVFAQAGRDFFEIFQGFSASLQNPGNACCIRLFGHRKILVRGIFRCFFALFSCFLSDFCEFLTCFRHFYAVPRTFCAVKFGQLHGFFHRFQRLGFVIPTEVRVNVACSEHQKSSHVFVSICSPHGFLFCGRFFINQLVIDMDLPRCLAVFSGALVDGNELDQLHAHLTG